MKAKPRIACIHVPHFAAQMEQRRQPDSRQPLIVRQGSIVLDASEAVSQRGVAPGDSLAQAMARAPGLPIVNADVPYYHQAWDEVITVLGRHSACVEDDRWGLAYAEAAGMGALYGDQGAWCRAVRKDIQERPGAQAMLGVATRHFTAWVAAQEQESWRGYTIVPGPDAAFLAPKPLSLLDIPNQQVRRRLGILGIETMGDFARLPVTAVAEQFGPEYRQAHRRAAGRDARPLKRRRQQVVSCVHDFELPERRGQALGYVLQQMGEELFETLTQDGMAATRIQVQIEIVDSAYWSKAAWASDGLGPQMLRGLIASWLRELEKASCASAGIVSATLQITGLGPASGRQLQLFTQMEDRYRLEDALRRLAKRHAAESVLQVQPDLPSDAIAAAHFSLRPL